VDARGNTGNACGFTIGVEGVPKLTAGNVVGMGVEGAPNTGSVSGDGNGVVACPKTGDDTTGKEIIGSIGVDGVPKNASGS
jgi:hypothetical protein